ncbi:aldo/keto reductase [uncultured Akkermansia sp.]|uniref:aldo/keto reductase n=1 Tax=uncultured Akkermansia sp. TaxID=512294 RepID=UPI00265CAF84|nr:aldo/keto reductase [uncultured Akkermansia sp.]
MKSMKIITFPGDTQQLNNGLPMPGIGYGTYLAPDDTAGVRSILDALEAGYRLIDTASVYGNEKTVGRAVRESDLPREEIFITSKVWNTDQGYETTLNAFEASLDRLQTDYLDLYLIHWPIPAGYEEDYRKLNRETWKAMERLYRDGRVKAIGVSNFLPHHLEALMEHADIMPMVNQLEINPTYHQEEAVAFCREHHILVESWGPLARGGALEEPILRRMADKHKKSVAQICLRWELQCGIVPLPKSVHADRIRTNLDIFNFSLDEGDMALIETLDSPGHYSIHPDHLSEE